MKLSELKAHIKKLEGLYNQLTRVRENQRMLRETESHHIRLDLMGLNLSIPKPMAEDLLRDASREVGCSIIQLCTDIGVEAELDE